MTMHQNIFIFQLPDDFEVVYSNLEGELVVGGVYLNLFIAQPHWVCITLFSVTQKMII